MKKREYICEECLNKFTSIEKRPRFCTRSCSAKYNNKRRIHSSGTKCRISISVKKYFNEHPMEKVIRSFEYVCEKCNSKFTTPRKFKKNRYVRCDKCIRKAPHSVDLSNIDSIMMLSKRTMSKIFRRMNIGCSNCGWNEGSGDIHHINGKKIENCDSHNNLTYLCPNCHRLAHNKKLDKNKIKNLTTYVGDNWKEFYNKIVALGE